MHSKFSLFPYLIPKKMSKNITKFKYLVLIISLFLIGSSSSYSERSNYRIGNIFFESKDVFDSTQNDWFWGAKVLNKLHTITQPFIIEDELLFSSDDDLNLDVIINTSVFILPLGNHLFKVGATYNWRDKTNIPTHEAKEELRERINEILNCDFEIVEHFAGVRPTVKDRKPLIGTHPDYSNIHILNGLGTRGVMLAPAMAKALFENIEFGKPIESAIDSNRFSKKG